MRHINHKIEGIMIASIINIRDPLIHEVRKAFSALFSFLMRACMSICLSGVVCGVLKRNSFVWLWTGA